MLFFGALLSHSYPFFSHFAIFCCSHLIFCSLCIPRGHVLSVDSCFPSITLFWSQSDSCGRRTRQAAEQRAVIFGEQEQTGRETGFCSVSAERFSDLFVVSSPVAASLSAWCFSLPIFGFYCLVLWVFVSLMTFDNVILYYGSWWHIVVFPVAPNEWRE